MIKRYHLPVVSLSSGTRCVKCYLTSLHAARAQVEGAPLELCCLVDSDPMAAVTWYKNDLIFMDDARDEDVAEIAVLLQKFIMSSCQEESCSKNSRRSADSKYSGY